MNCYHSAFFSGEWQDHIVENARQGSQGMLTLYETAEHLFPGYGPKIVLSHLILIWASVFAGCISVIWAWFLNPPVPDTLPDEINRGRAKRQASCFLAFAALILVQMLLLYHPFSSHGGRLNGMPILIRSMFWALMCAVAIIAAVTCRRGSWSLAE